MAGHANSATQTRAESGAPPPPTALDPAFVLKLFLDQMNQLRQDLDGVQNSQRRWMSDLLADQAGRLERQHATNFGLMHEQGESMQREFAACLAQQAEQMRQAHLAELLAQATRLRAVAQTQVREQGEALRQEAAENLRAEAERLRAELRPAPVDAPASHEKASPTSQPRPPADKSRAKNADDTRTSRLDDNRLRRNLPKWAYDVAAEPFYAHLRRGFWDAPGWKNCLFAAPKAALSALLYLVDQFAAMVAWLHASGMLNLMNMMLSVYLRAPRVA